MRFDRTRAAGGLALVLCLWAAAGSAQEYKLTVGDVIDFDILDDEDPPRTLTIGQDGQMQLPLLGTVAVAGLTVPGAQEQIRRAFVEGDLLRDPKISLSIAAFRPVYVLGDVKSPGLVEFRAQMTLEQAVGLAGGPSRVTGNSDEQLLNEAVLRGELRVLSAEIARQAAAVARLEAQIDGTEALSPDALPAEFRDMVDADRFADYARVEAEILAGDRQALADRRAALDAQSAALGREIAAIGERISSEETRIANFRAERDRVAGLVDRGVLARVDLTGAERDLLQSSGPMLDAKRDLAETERLKADIDRQMADLVRADRREALLQLQVARLKLEQLVAERNSTEERVFLVTSWQADRSRDAMRIETSYRIRRDQDGQTGTQPAALTERLLPGDVVLVTIELPG